MKSTGVTLQSTYFTKNWKKKHCVTSSEICINRLGTTTQIFKVVDYLSLMSEKLSHFRKRQKHVARNIFPTPQKKLYPCTSEIFLELQKNRNNSVCIKVKNFPKSRSSRPELFLRKGVPQICSKFTGEHPLLCNRPSAWMFSCEFTVQFQNTFS